MKVAWCLGLALLLVVTGRTTADTDLTSLLNATFLPRTEDPALHEWAHVRAAFQVTYSGGFCGEGSLTHAGSTTAETLACNYTGPERAIEQWQESLTHDAILSDPAFTHLGCGSADGMDGAVFYACVLASISDSQPTSAPVSPRPSTEASETTPMPAASAILLPNTALQWSK